jgi:CPA2 family monovalent cation:H+ antiporter-2
LPDKLGGSNTLLWLLAMLLALPLHIATIRKLQALGMVVSELSVKRSVAGEKTAGIRAIIANTVFASGVAGLALLTLALSSALLPPRNTLVVLTLLVATIAWVQWRALVKIYAKAQLALEEVWTQPRTPVRPESDLPRLPGPLRAAQIDTCRVDATSPAAGKLIREVELRKHTGASIVALERNGGNLVNPGPDEEIQAGDLVCLLGDSRQLEAARRLLGTQPDPSAPPPEPAGPADS